MAYGNVEFGTLLDENDHSVTLGRLAIDYDTQEFWQRPATGEKAFMVNWKNVAHYLAVGAIRYDDPQMEKRLLGFLQRKEKSDEIKRRAKEEQEAHEKAVERVKENNKLIKQTRLRAGMARVFWVAACLIAIAVTFIATIPPNAPAEAAPSIAGVGQDYGIPSSELAQASYIAALGDATNLYGVIVDQNIIEVGAASTNDTSIKENVMLNPYVSQQPIHMRPLYYDKSSFYQSALSINDYTGGSSAVYLQNPKGYKENKAANDLVLTGGPGISCVTIASPEAYQALSGDEAASQLEDAQESLAENDVAYEDPDRVPSAPPEGWIGFDSCDIDGSWVVASYWYRQSAMLGGNLMRRVIVYDVQNVLDTGAAGLEQMNSANMNYQVLDSSYYDPVVSTSRATNGQLHWIAYTKQDATGQTGVYVRRVETTTDILNESYENTLPGKALTDSNAPITNYTLDGDYLFFEQTGAIWYMDLSKVTVTMVMTNGTMKPVYQKNNPIKICSTSDIRPDTTRDEEFRASQTGVAVTPKCHYKVMKVITSGGVEYGIVFVDSSRGDLVFCPTHAIIVAGSTSGNVSTDSNASDVQDQSQSEIERIRRENEGIGEYADDYDPTANTQQNQPQQQEAGGVATSTHGDRARAWLVSDTVPTEARGWPMAETTITKVVVSLSDRGDSTASVVAFTVRGEHVIWIEEDQATHERSVKCSPVYYKNDAVKIQEQIFGEDDGSVDTQMDQTQQNEIASGQQFQENLAQQQAQDRLPQGNQQTQATDQQAQEQPQATDQQPQATDQQVQDPQQQAQQAPAADQAQPQTMDQQVSETVPIQPQQDQQIQQQAVPQQDVVIQQ